MLGFIPGSYSCSVGADRVNVRVHTQVIQAQFELVGLMLGFIPGSYSCSVGAGTVNVRVHTRVIFMLSWSW